MLLTRRDLMKHGAAGAALLTAGGVPFRAFAEGDELTIAYNVNLPVVRSDGRPFGGQPDHPGHLSVDLRPVHRAGPGPEARPRSPDRMGLERRPLEDRDEGARGRHLARRLAGDAGRRRLVARARRRREDRQPDPVRLGQDRQLLHRRQHGDGRRQVVRADDLQMDGLPHRLRAAEGLLREGRAGGLREGADRIRPLQGRAVRAERLPQARRARGLLGRAGGLQDRHHQVRARRDEPRRRDRFRQEPGGVRHPL